MTARLALLAAAVLVGAAACGGPDGADQPVRSGAPAGDAAPTGTLTIFAAASLSDVFARLGAELEEQNPELDVRFNFAGSSALAAQLEQGAPTDVFASADEDQMTRVVDAGLAPEAELFASNRLVLAFPPDDPAGIDRSDSAGIPSLADLLDRDVTLAVCAPEVPCGAAAAEVLDRTGLSDVPDTYEDDVRAVLTKVQLGEVDAGLVYRTDVSSAGDAVGARAFREAEAARNRYPVAVLDDAPNPDAARAFVDLLLSDEGRQVLTEAGFFEP
ncbi:molybdate ABC transporter substrate-binding protein [Blastococcus mobilis]|uniref:Molybdate transport system substrate-binding protein n=1 Tax=Blastococcus mobilis TaxID=1938746 RepID=A0A238YJ02_9ACTN|nr:molybdate ABC transporter substrate-binding protein [Blastococcus mobilis]SNR70778.1 molybdate transport system substrate-binding protein [Blastococcus mobilis]